MVDERYRNSGIHSRDTPRVVVAHASRQKEKEKRSRQGSERASDLLE